MFVNVEVWHNVLKKDIDTLIDLDKYLMKKILNVHSKAPIEALYLETSAIPLNYILAERRINYLHNILLREDSELVKRVYIAQKENPHKGDWYNTLQDDMTLLSFSMSESEMTSATSRHIKNVVRRCVKSAAFNELKSIQATHTKVKDISYPIFSLQAYMTSSLFSSEEMSTVFNLRTNTINGYKMCFTKAYPDDKTCKLGCLEEDSISHSYSCKVINLQDDESSIEYSSLYSTIVDQKKSSSIIHKKKQHKVSSSRSWLCLPGPHTGQEHSCWRC